MQTHSSNRADGLENPLPQGARTALSRSATAWYAAAVVGQLLFVAFILLFYYPTFVSGDIASWDNKPNITGFVSGDGAGNFMFALHVGMAAIMVAGGLFQLVPAIRRRWPMVHRWNGRLFMIVALALAIGGLWLVWVRGSYLNLTGAIGISFNAVLIISFAVLAWRSAVRRQFAEHRRWALRLFVAANAVWFMRLGYMIWGVGTGGLGIGDAMDGPFDYFLAFGNSLVPLLMTELYLRVQQGRSTHAHVRMSIALWMCALLTLAASALAWLIMWSPYIFPAPG